MRSHRKVKQCYGRHWLHVSVGFVASAITLRIVRKTLGDWVLKSSLVVVELTCKARALVQQVSF